MKAILINKVKTEHNLYSLDIERQITKIIQKYRLLDEQGNIIDEQLDKLKEKIRSGITDSNGS